MIDTPERFALYVLPRPGEAWSDFATSWLGWDAMTGQSVAHPDLPNLDADIAEVTATPRRYGLHATIKPPFRLAEGTTRTDLETAACALCAKMAPVTLDGLALTRLGRFLALTPRGDTHALDQMAANTVRQLDPFRAPAGPAELAKRRAAGLTEAQDANLRQWGYPYVMESFRFHITLTGKLLKEGLEPVEAALTAELTPLLPAPFVIGDLALAGEDSAGRFHLLERYPLGPV